MNAHYTHPHRKGQSLELAVYSSARYTHIVARIIAVCNQKGGVGKTTTVFNLGSVLAARGVRTLLVDLDPQAALTAWAGFDTSRLKQTMYTALMDGADTLAPIVLRAAENLTLAPSSLDLASAEVALSTAPDRAQRLQRALQGTDSAQYDIVLIDTPATLGVLTVNGLVAAHKLLIPVQCEALSMRGVRAVLEAVWLVRGRLNHALELLGILPTIFRAEVPGAQDALAEMQAVFRSWVLAPIPADDVAITGASASTAPLLRYAPSSAAAQAYLRLAEFVTNDTRVP